MAENKVIEKDLGAASAYSYAVEQGYAGTEEEFAKEQANFAKNAAQVAEDREAVEKLKTDTQGIKDAAVKDVGDAQNAALTSIENTAREKLTAIATAGSAQVKAVQDAGALEVEDVKKAGADERAELDAAAEATAVEVEERIEAKGAAVLATIPEEYTETYQRTLRNESRISRNEKRLDNIEKGIMPEKYMEDNTVAYKKSVPVDAGPFVAINKVGGMTRKCSNLLPLDDRSRDVNGVTVSVQGGVVTVSGTANKSGGRTSAISTVFMLKAGTYTFSCTREISGLDAYMNNYNSGALVIRANVSGGVFILQEDTPVYFGVNVTADVTYAGSLSFMLNSGDTALPYEPYFEGLRSAPVTEVESVGANLLDTKLFATSVVTVTENNDGSFTITNTLNGVTMSAKSLTGKLPAGTYTIKNESTKILYVMQSANDYSKPTFDGQAVTFVYDGYSTLKLLFADFKENESLVAKIMLNKGTTALPYTPYTRNTLPIPEAVQALDGYGWGVNDTVYNYIDWEKKQFVKRFGRVDLGTQNWKVDTDSTTVSYYFKSKINDIKPSSYPNMVIGNGYTIHVSRNNLADKGISLANNVDSKNVCVADSAYTDAETFKAAMSGVMLYYELETQVITDISDLLTEDNYIPVEGGGTVTMVNEYEYAVPSEITYALKEAE